MGPNLNLVPMSQCLYVCVCVCFVSCEVRWCVSERKWNDHIVGCYYDRLTTHSQRPCPPLRPDSPITPNHTGLGPHNGQTTTLPASCNCCLAEMGPNIIKNQTCSFQFPFLHFPQCSLKCTYSRRHKTQQVHKLSHVTRSPFHEVLSQANEAANRVFLCRKCPYLTISS